MIRKYLQESLREPVMVTDREKEESEPKFTCNALEDESYCPAWKVSDHERPKR